MSEFKRGFASPQPEKENAKKGDSSSFCSSSTSSRFNTNGNGSNGQTNGASKYSLTFLTPAEIRDYVVPANAILVGDNHILRGEVVLFAGPPAVGKSRAIDWLATCGATGKPWFDHQIHQKFRTLIVQNENGRIRLKLEFTEIGPAIDNHVQVLESPPMGLEFHKPAFRDALTKAIDAFQPALVEIDPFNAACPSEKQKDIADTFHNIFSVVHQIKDPPATLVDTHTRKPGPHERANGRALLYEVCGSHILTSVPRTVWVLQHASDDVNEDRVILTCCKNNNGELGSRSAWRRTVGGAFDPVLDFDWSSFDSPDEKKTTLQSWPHIPDLIERNGGFVRKDDLAKLVQADFGGSIRTAERQIKKAGQKGVIRFDTNRHGWVKA